MAGGAEGSGVGGRSDAAAVAPLVELFVRHSDVQRRLMAVEAFGNIPSAEAALALVEMIAHDPDSGVAGRALLALSKVKTEKTLREMRSLMRTEDPEARSRLAVALADLGAASADGGATD